MEDVQDIPPPQSSNGHPNNNGNTVYPYPTKHEPSGPYLAIHSLVVQPEYRNQGVARAILENYIKSIEAFNTGADTAKPTITRRGTLIKDKVQKRNTPIEKLILVTRSHLLDFFVSMGFRWRATTLIGKESVYELEREVTSSLPSVSPTSPLASSALKTALSYLQQKQQQQPNSKEQDCYLVDAFANPRRCGSGNSAAIVVLDGPPSKMIAERQSKINDEEDGGQWGMMNEQLNEILSNVVVDEEEEEELAEMRAEVWMHFVAREFQQPATGMF
jgi:GNAT superfamily N-acetyltransferase